VVSVVLDLEARARYLRLLVSIPARNSLRPSALIESRLSFFPPIVLMTSDSTRHASIQEVYAAVSGAVSQNPKEMSASAARLKGLMEQPGTLDLLQQIAAQKTAPLHIRQLSIIQVKNVVSTLWRSRRLVRLMRYLPWHFVQNVVLCMSGSFQTSRDMLSEIAACHC